MFQGLISVFLKYCSADEERSNEKSEITNTMNVREFRLLMTDCLLLGTRPGDDTLETRSAATRAFYCAQSSDESDGLALSSLPDAERRMQGNVNEAICFVQYLEAIARVAIDKWDDDEIPDIDKIQLAYEAVVVLDE